MTDTSEPVRAPRVIGIPHAAAWRTALLAGIGAALAIAVLAAADSTADLSLIIAPFGASCALVFGAPTSPLAQPRNVIGGHLISAALGLLAAALIGSPEAAMAVGVGLAIAGMLLTGTLHPPAGANPIVIVLAHVSWSFLLTPVLCGALVIVAIGAIYHRFLTGDAYVFAAAR